MGGMRTHAEHKIVCTKHSGRRRWRPAENLAEVWSIGSTPLPKTPARDSRLLSSAARPSVLLTRDFAPPRHREFAFIGEESQDLNVIRGKKRKNCAKKSGRPDRGKLPILSRYRNIW